MSRDRRKDLGHRRPRFMYILPDLDIWDLRQTNVSVCNVLDLKRNLRLMGDTDHMCPPICQAQKQTQPDAEAAAAGNTIALQNLEDKACLWRSAKRAAYGCTCLQQVISLKHACCLHGEFDCNFYL